jgi:hypothetical protein
MNNDNGGRLDEWKKNIEKWQKRIDENFWPCHTEMEKLKDYFGLIKDLPKMKQTLERIEKKLEKNTNRRWELIIGVAIIVIAQVLTKLL